MSPRSRHDHLVQKGLDLIAARKVPIAFTPAIRRGYNYLAVRADIMRNERAESAQPAKAK